MKQNQKITATEVMYQKLSQEVPPSVLLNGISPESLPGYLNQVMGQRNISTDAVAELSGINRASLYKILNGTTKQPQRNVLIRLALTLRLNFAQTQKLLKYGGRAALSGQRPRDILLSDGIIHGRSIFEVNGLLVRYGFPDLFAKD